MAISETNLARTFVHRAVSQIDPDWDVSAIRTDNGPALLRIIRTGTTTPVFFVQQSRQHYPTQQHPEIYDSSFPCSTDPHIPAQLNACTAPFAPAALPNACLCQQPAQIYRPPPPTLPPPHPMLNQGTDAYSLHSRLLVSPATSPPASLVPKACGLLLELPARPQTHAGSRRNWPANVTTASKLPAPRTCT